MLCSVIEQLSKCGESQGCISWSSTASFAWDLRLDPKKEEEPAKDAAPPAKDAAPPQRARRYGPGEEEEEEEVEGHGEMRELNRELEELREQWEYDLPFAQDEPPRRRRNRNAESARPATYTVRLRAGDRTLAHELKVLVDPDYSD